MGREETRQAKHNKYRITLYVSCILSVILVTVHWHCVLLPPIPSLKHPIPLHLKTLKLLVT